VLRIIKKFYKIRWFLLLLVYAGMIFYLSSLRGDIFPSKVDNWDKLFHFFLYAGFGYVLIRFLKTCVVFESKVHFGRIYLLIGCLYALSDEVHQIFVPLRNFSFGDLFADTLGLISSLKIFGGI